MGFRLGPFKMGVVNKSETSLLSCVTVRSMMASCNSENRTMVLEFRVFYLFTYAKEMHDDGNNVSLFFTPRNIEGQHVFFFIHTCTTVFVRQYSVSMRNLFESFHLLQKTDLCLVL